MLTINITKVEIENFRSFKKETFSVPDSSGLKFLSGENQIQPRLGANGCGKALADSLFLDTPLGKVQWGSLQVGDFVFGDDGKPTKITARFPQGRKQLYKITFDDNTSTLACAEHQWQVSRWNPSLKKKENLTLTTAEIVSRGVIKRSGNSELKWEIPSYSAVQFSEKLNLEVHPYVLGQWLGDGTKNSSEISVDNRDEDVIKLLTSVKYPYKPNGARKSCDYSNRSIIKDDKGSKRVIVFGLLPLLKKLRVGHLGSHERFIPKNYLYSSKQQRLQLLRGLMDSSDGYCDKGTSCYFYSSSGILAEQVAWLCRSLGGWAKQKPPQETHYKKNGKKIICRKLHEVCLNLRVSPFLSKRKTSRFKVKQDRYYSKRIVTIQPSHIEECSCIQVDSLDKLFLANDFIVTHNSSLWKAVEWCFYGAARINAVMRWQAENVKISTDFTIGEVVYNITRSGPPMKAYLNGELVEQHKIDQTVRLSRERFLHSVIFHQGQKLFPDISVPERGDLLDEVLNLDLWQRCSLAATTKSSLLDKELSKLKISQSYIDGQLLNFLTDTQLQDEIEAWERDRQQELSRLREKDAEWLSLHEKAIALLKSEEEGWLNMKYFQLERKADEIGTLEVQIDELKTQLPSPFDASRLHRLVDEKARLYGLKETWMRLKNLTEATIERMSKDEKFWADTKICGMCSQPIDEKKRSSALQTIQIQLKKDKQELIELNSKIDKLNVEIQENEKFIDQLKKEEIKLSERKRSIERETRQVQVQMKAKEDEAESLLKEKDRGNPFTNQISIAQAEKSPFVEQITNLKLKSNPLIEKAEKIKSDREAKKKEKAAVDELIQSVMSNIVAVDYWKHGFKRIRLYFVQQVLAALEIEIASAISALGLDGWQVNLSTETETKSGTMKLGVQITIKSPVSEGVWETWSGGESQRLRLAIAMGLASLIQRAAGVKFNLEVWDEPTSWMSGEGIEDLLQALQYRAESLKKSIWVCDHRALTFSGFSEIWSIVKGMEGSLVYKIAESIT